ncbi:MAG TPA: mannose-1-phosphate guanylyltransferase [Candidatus Limnocylindrales bacterium]|nr:mannose-1-phosphate guanylyltransferase [Candidatus Limnocylindrales bacterium]
MYVVVLAGGGGTRLWPLSTPERPKPFLPLLGQETLLQRTVSRLAPLVDPEDVRVVAARRYTPIVRAQLPDVRVLPEPAGRNTAAAIALATVSIDRPDDDVMVVLPADQWIDDEARFREVLMAAVDRLATGAFGIDDPLVTLGVRPTRPSTDYGYLRPDLDHSMRNGSFRAYPLQGFEEKPTESRARELLGVEGVAWNAGMFVWRRRAIRAALEKYTPLVTLLAPAAGKEMALEMAYDRMVGTSIDHAVMESAASDGRVVMARLDAGWNDVGSWTALLSGLGVRGATGRVVGTAEVAKVRPGDLVVRRRARRLELDGPAAEASDAILDPTGPSALLTGAASARPIIEALLERVNDVEAP